MAKKQIKSTTVVVVYKVEGQEFKLELDKPAADEYVARLKKHKINAKITE